MPNLLLSLALVLPPATQDLTLQQGDVICLLGNATAERMQHHGWLEVELQRRFPELELSVRNLGFGADELTVHQRTMNFGKFSADGMEMNLANQGYVVWDRYLDHCDASVVFAFFGYNESFAGEEGLDDFRSDLEHFVDHVAGQRYDERSAPRLVLFSSLAHEATGDPNLPDGRQHNARIALYNGVMAEVAADRDVTFVDIFAPMQERYTRGGEPLTINGIHLNERGNASLAEEICAAMFPNRTPRRAPSAALREAVLEKNLLWFNRYRVTDGYNVYGGRSRQVYQEAGGDRRFPNFEVLQRELDHIDVLVANRDREIQALADGRTIEVDDSNAPPLLAVLTNKPGPGAEGEFPMLGGEEALGRMTPAPGMRIELFADEEQFPELANPVQMAFDTRGRLWVAVWPTYTHWTPNQPMNDKLVILEDTDGDGRADECKTFAGDLHNPTGFEFWNGGVLLAQVPDLVFLEDTDGDDVYDRKEHLLHGLSSGDTHHSANSFVLGPGGALYFQEGTFHQSQVESIFGPVRNHNGCVWRFDPRTFRVERYIPYNYANPHGHVFDRFGQDFMTDGTGNVNYYSLAFSGYIPHPQKHSSYFPFFKQRSRPCAGTEILSSSHFPGENQGNYLVANVIGFQGIFQYQVVDDGSGFDAVEVDPIVSSTDINFRPSDIEVGPDGALYFLDWHNPLIGHLQHHIRDPSRDNSHGRVYRVTSEGRDLLEPAQIHGRPIGALLALLKSPEDRVRYRTRIELSGRDSDAVVDAAREWAYGLDPADAAHEHHLLEALWLHQQHNRMDRPLLERLLHAEDARVRAAATRVLRYMRHQVNEPLALLRRQAVDEHPRVRLEAVVAASFFDDAEAAEIALEALRHPTDRFLDYALGETMRALEPRWKEALRNGSRIAQENPAGVAFLLDRVGPGELLGLPRTASVLSAVLTRHGLEESARVKAAAELAALDGSSSTDQLLAAISQVDAGQSGHAAHVLHELFSILLARLEQGEASREDLERLAEDGRQSTTRALAYAGLVILDGDVESAWASASTSAAGVAALLEGLPSIPEPGLRAGLHDRVRPLMFSVPAQMSDAGTGGAGSGMEASFFTPCPRDARRETLEALTPAEQLTTPGFNLDIAAVRKSDSFGMTFRGTVHVPKAGRYTFWTRSDDGSRLYIGETLVVDNDGDHGMAEKNGAIELGAGPQPILVTYYERGGADGLTVSWKGPGFKKEPVPVSALGRSDARTFRAAAIRAMAHIPGNDSQKLRDAARLIGDEVLLAPTVELLGSIPAEQRTAELVRPVVDTLAAFVSGLGPKQRTSAEISAALALAGDLADHLPAAEAAAARDQLSGLGGTLVLVRTLPHQMLYDLSEFVVEAGKPVSIVFQNNDVMPHNLVITLPGAMAAVGEAAELLSGQPGAEARGFIPDVDGVLWHTRLLFPGESERLDFIAPSDPGDHPFVCTYPGHWRVMNGIMRVVDEVGDSPTLTRRESGEASAPAREFVRNWALEDMTPHLGEGWEQGRSVGRGRALFTDAGCIKCHSIEGQGATGGPPLSAIGSKYRGADLLKHILEPSAEVLEEYRFFGFDLDDGARIIGRVVDEDEANLHVVEVLLEPEEVTLVPKDAVVDRWDTQLSPMPTGLLVTFDDGEILDLLTYLQDAADEHAAAEAAKGDPWVVYEGGEGPGKGRHIVLVSGDDEYRSEEALPMLGRILAEHHGFKCTVLFATNPETGEIQPDYQNHIAGMHFLDDADLMFCFLRFRELPDADMKHFVDFVESGKPIVGVRTATHAFHYKDDPDSPYAHYDFRNGKWRGGFGQQILGDTWISHHGHHGSQSTRGVIEPGREDHPVLRGVEDVWGPTDVYGIRNLDDQAVILLRGAVLENMSPDGQPVEGPQNDPMIPLVWLRELPQADGSSQRVACSTIGASTDCLSEDLRRVFVNACYWGLGLEGQIPARSKVDIVGKYSPTNFGFGSYVKGVMPADHARD